MDTSRALRSKPAMVISAVCSRWRRNALSMPVIWSRISLQWKMDASRDYRKDEHTEVFFPLSNFLNRSQQCLMTVNLVVYGSPFLKQGVLHPLLEQLFGQMVHWQDFSFDSGDYDVKALLNCHGIQPFSFPVLSKLCLTWDEDDLNPFIDTAPNLQSLTWGYDFEGIPNEFSYYSQLFYLDFLPNYPDIDSLFERCPNLFSLRIPESWRDYNPQIIACSSKLEILTVRHGEHAPENSVYPLLRLPSLKALHLEIFKLRKHVKGRKSWRHFNPFIAFVQRSSFQLTTFSVQQLSISDVNLVDILVHLPTLQNLTVDELGILPKCSSISSGFIESLHGYRTSSLRPQEAAIVPRMRSLRLLNVAAITFDDLTVVEMVQSRWIPARPHDVEMKVDCLRVFTMTFLSRSEAEAGDIYSSLAPIERDGMMIVVQMLG
ncbi:hypothetical protein BDP27DRAFT_1327884 [Rhodocollybia butyracea]|uniref:F-box domain-containing protein n=1 Tax=Rhodocollybia butyracea TaxID=206335 RepID=A0A9P5PLR5_9AGAR|nr:hypothetical protein BDP27DRAFT_1327884 [Rhodocollybia butyracea]